MPLFKDIAFRLDGNTFRPAAPPYLQTLDAEQKLDLKEILKSIAWNTRPLLLPVGAHLSWAQTRYLPLFARGKSLRLIAEWSDVDPHQKTILSDDLGVGATTHLLESSAGFRFVPTSYVIREGRPIRPVRRTSSRQSADYIGTRGTRHRIALECKGTQSSRAALAQFLARGQRQKRNTKRQFGRKLQYGLVAGIFAPQHHSDANALIRFRDPPLSSNALKIENLSEDELNFRIFCGTLAGQLYAAGAEHTALHVAHRIDDPLGPLARDEIEKLIEPQEVFRLSRCIRNLPNSTDVAVTSVISDDLRSALLSPSPLVKSQSLALREWAYHPKAMESATTTPHGVTITVSSALGDTSSQ